MSLFHLCVRGTRKKHWSRDKLQNKTYRHWWIWDFSLLHFDQPDLHQTEKFSVSYLSLLVFVSIIVLSRMSLICPWDKWGAFTYFYVLWNAGIKLACGRRDAMYVQSHSTFVTTVLYCVFLRFSRFDFYLLVNLYFDIISVYVFSFYLPVVGVCIGW